jgi:hypothetical protein
MCVSFFATNFVWTIFHSKKKWASYYHKCLLVFRQITRYFCQILMKRELSRQIFEKYLNIKFNENPSSGSRVQSGRTRRQTRRN